MYVPCIYKLIEQSVHVFIQNSILGIVHLGNPWTGGQYFVGLL